MPLSKFLLLGLGVLRFLDERKKTYLLYVCFFDTVADLFCARLGQTRLFLIAATPGGGRGTVGISPGSASLSEGPSFGGMLNFFKNVMWLWFGDLILGPRVFPHPGRGHPRSLVFFPIIPPASWFDKKKLASCTPTRSARGLFETCDPRPRRRGERWFSPTDLHPFAREPPSGENFL